MLFLFILIFHFPTHYLLSYLLGYNSLTGSIPSELGDLTSLTAILLREYFMICVASVYDLFSLLYFSKFSCNVSGTNSLTGSLPSLLGNLKLLKTLIMSEWFMNI